MEKKMFRMVLATVAVGLILALGAIAFASSIPQTATCPADGGLAILDANSCSTTGMHIVCRYDHQPTTGPSHSFYVRVQ